MEEHGPVPAAGEAEHVASPDGPRPQQLAGEGQTVPVPHGHLDGRLQARLGHEGRAGQGGEVLCVVA